MSEENKAEAKALADAEKRLTDVVSENLTKFRAGIDKQLAEIEEKGKASETLGVELTETKEQLETQRIELEKVRDRLEGIAGAKAVESGFEWKTAGDRIGEAFDEFKEAWSAHQSRKVKTPFNYRMSMKGFFPTSRDLERKTDITSGTVGSSTPGILTPDRVRDYVPGAERRFTLRDLIMASPTDANTVEFPQENVFTNAASPQTEASDKAESALTFTISSEAVRTLAHVIPATAQVLDDWSQLRRILDSKMMYGLKLKEEDEILNGSGTGVHLNGLVTQATAYAGTYDVGADTRLDTLGWAALEAEDDDEEVDFFVTSPVTFWSILHIKDQASNIGNYVVGDPLGGGLLNGVMLWGRRWIVTNTMTASGFLAGNSTMCEIFDRQEANIAISTEHSDFFIKNMVMIRAEERLALAVYRTSAFVYGTFS